MAHEILEPDDTGHSAIRMQGVIHTLTATHAPSNPDHHKFLVDIQPSNTALLSVNDARALAHFLLDGIGEAYDPSGKAQSRT